MTEHQCKCHTSDKKNLKDKGSSCSGGCSCHAKQTDEPNLPLISSAFFIVTERCNLACRYCFVHQNPSQMTYETAFEATQFLIKNAEASNQVPSINFFGGEPLLKWDEIIVPLTRYIRETYQKPFSLGITTNGVLLDDEKLAFIQANEIGVLLSIDGAKTTQDINRPFHNGKGSFDKIEPNLKKLLAILPNATFRATIHRETVQHVYENMRFAIETGYNNFFFIPNVFDTWSEAEKQTLKEQVHLFGQWFIEEARQNKILKFNPFTEKLKEIKKINQAHTNRQCRPLNGRPGEGKCGLGVSRFASVGPDGTLYGCQEMTSNNGKNNLFKIGDIYQGTDNKKRLALAALFDKKAVQGSNCETCLLNNICDGGCVANNYLASGNMNQMPDMLCYWYQILLEEAIYVAQVLGNERNECFKKEFFN